MGHMPDLDRRIRQGGDDAIAAVGEIERLRLELYMRPVPNILVQAKEKRWISVEERLPEDEDRELTSVLGWNGVSVREVVFAPRERPGSQWSSAAGGHEFITHWMPLPEPPEVK